MKKRMLALTLAIAFVVGMLVQAAEPLPVSAATVENGRVSDANTTLTYTDALGNGTSTRYSGRVWTDKTVFTENAIFTGDDRYTIEIGEDDFLVAYSALGTSTSVSGKTKVPVDVVFVIDLSGSMSNENSNMNNGYSRIYNTIEALNASIKKLMDANKDNRIAVVGYEETAITLLPLDHYTPGEGYDTYFSVSRRSGNKDNANLTTHAVNSAGRTVSGTKKVSGGTNIHMGVDAGMDILRNVQDTTVTIDGKEVQRIPSLMLMSDGSPTYSGADSTGWWSEYVPWWDPSGTDGTGYSHGQGDRYAQSVQAYAKFTLKTIMNASYMKQQINEKYGLTNAAHKMKIYTVGLGTEDLGDSTDKACAAITLDPENNINREENVAKYIRDAWTSYSNGVSPQLDGYTFQHPDDDISSIAYNDKYYAPSSAEDVASAFEDIMGDINLSAPEVPTEVAPGANPIESGYITYTDTIGEYMEVKDVKEILWSSREFTTKSTTTSGNVTTYTFEGEIDSPVYGQQNVHDVIITVTNNEDNTQTLMVKIPASAIPLRVNAIELNENGEAVSNQPNNAYPMRVFYTVGMKEGIIVDGKVDPSKVSSEYLERNTNKNTGEVSFYSNLFSGKSGTLPDYEDKTRGDAEVTFEPADTNPYYFNQEQVPLYMDSSCVTAATGNFNPSGTYYRKVTYYEGTGAPKTVYVQISTSAYQADDFETNADGQLCLKEGTYRISALGNFVSEKEPEGSDIANVTGTAQTSYYPTYDKDAPGDVKSGVFTVYLGNNGKLTAPIAASLSITKDVTAEVENAVSNVPYSFTVSKLTDGGGVDTSYSYDKVWVRAEDGTLTTEGFSFQNGKLEVQVTGTGTVQILNLENGTYTVEENTSALDTVTVEDVVYSWKEVTYQVGSGNAASGPAQVTISTTGDAVPTTAKQTVTVFNEYSSEQTLTVTKTVGGNMGDTTKGFSFTLTVTKDGTPYTAALDATKTGAGIDGSETLTLSSGDDSTYYFQLKHDQEIAIEIPYGYTATVTEAEEYGYLTDSRSYQTGTAENAVPKFSENGQTFVQSVAMTQPYTVDYQNVLNAATPTGMDLPNKGAWVMTGVAAASGTVIFGCSLLMWLRRRRDWM